MDVARICAYAIAMVCLISYHEEKQENDFMMHPYTSAVGMLLQGLRYVFLYTFNFLLIYWQSHSHARHLKRLYTCSLFFNK